MKKANYSGWPGVGRVPRMDKKKQKERTKIVRKRMKEVSKKEKRTKKYM
jgi:hypothetical protein